MSDYETIRPNEFTAQPAPPQPKPIAATQQPNSVKKSSKANKFILGILIVCIVLLAVAGIYHFFFARKYDEDVEPGGFTTSSQNQQQHPVSQPSRNDRIRDEMEKKKPQSSMPTTSAIEKVREAQNRPLATIVEEPTQEEMATDFEAEKRQKKIITEVLDEENNVEYPLEDSGEVSIEIDNESDGGDSVVVDVAPAKCDFVKIAGKNAGQLCGRKCKDGNSRCTSHLSK